MSKFFFINLANEGRRYDFSKFMELTDNYDPLTSFFTSELNNLPVDGYHKVRGEEARPDLLSHNIYRDTQFWWLIMAYNSIQKAEDIVEGMTIKYPSLTSLEDLYFSLKIQEQVNNKT